MAVGGACRVLFKYVPCTVYAVVQLWMSPRWQCMTAQLHRPHVAPLLTARLLRPVWTGQLVSVSRQSSLLAGVHTVLRKPLEAMNGLTQCGISHGVSHAKAHKSSLQPAMAGLASQAKLLHAASHARLQRARADCRNPVWPHPSARSQALGSQRWAALTAMSGRRDQVAL